MPAKAAKKNTKDDQATNLLALVKSLNAPQEVICAADDAMHAYMNACDLRRAGYQNRISGVRLRNKAKCEARIGDKKMKLVRAWLEVWRASKAADT